MFQVSQDYLHQKELKKQRSSEAKNGIAAKIQETGLIKAIKKMEASEVTILTRFIVIIAITGDLFGLIPVAGSFFSFFFFIVLTMLYFFDSTGRGFVGNTFRRKIRKFFLKGLLLAIEFFFSPVPGLTVEALIHLTLLRKGYYKKLEKVNNKIEQIKKILK